MSGIFSKPPKWKWQFALVFYFVLTSFSFLMAQDRPDAGRRSQRGSRHNVTAIAFSPDGKTLAISRGSTDYMQRYGQIDLWDIETGKIRHVIKGFDGSVFSVAFSPDSQTVVSGSAEYRDAKLRGNPAKGKLFTEIKWWDVKTGELKFKQTKPTDERRTVINTISSDGKLLASVEYYVQISNVLQSSIDVSSGSSTPLPLSSEGGIIGSSVTNVVNLNLLNAQTGENNAESKGLIKSTSASLSFHGVSSFIGTPFRFNGAVFSPVGDLLAVGTTEEVKIWNIKTHAVTLKLRKFGGQIGGMSFTPDGKILAIADVISERHRSGDKFSFTIRTELKFYDVLTGNIIKTLKYDGEVSYLSFTADLGLLIGSTAYDQNQAFSKLERMDLQTGRLSNVINKQKGARPFVLSPNGRQIAFIDGRTSVSVWDLQTQRTKYKFDEINDSENGRTAFSNRYLLDVHRILSVDFSLNGNTLAAGNEENEIKLWDPRTGELKIKLIGHKGAVTSVIISADGKSLLSGSDDQTLRLWDLQTGKEKKLFNTNGRPLGSVAMSSDGSTIAGISDSAILLWDAKGGELTKTIETDLAPINAAVFSTDGQTLITGGDDGAVRLWNVETGEIKNSLAVAENKITTIGLAPGGKVLACAVEDGTIIILDLQTGSLIQKMKKHDGPINALAFSSDGKWMASGGDDRKAIIWETSSWKSKHALKDVDLSITSLAFSPDGQLLASGAGNLSVILWDVKTGKLDRTLK